MEIYRQNNIIIIDIFLISRCHQYIHTLLGNTIPFEFFSILSKKHYDEKTNF